MSTTTPMDRFRNTAPPDRDWWASLWPDPDGTLRELEIGGGTLVDIGCGDGHFTLPAATLVDHVYAVDIDPEQLDRLESTAREAGVENVEPIQGDARDLQSLLPEPVDVALVANTFHGVDDPTGFATAVREILTDAGRFVVVNWYDRPATETTVLGEPRGPPEGLRMSPDETVDVVEPAGFEAVETVALEPHHYGVVFRKV